MQDLKVAIPLTFALALAAVPTSATASVGDPSELLKPGSLRTLLSPSSAVIGKEFGGSQADQGTRQKIACYYGYWRRC